MDVSIVIPTKNGGHLFEKVLDAVFKQKTEYEYEVICVDSGSKDGTLDVIRKYPCRLFQIEPSEFGHGKTRNYGASKGNGTYIIFITQDALPATDTWLQNFIDAMKMDPEIVGGFGIHYPYPDCNLLDKRDLDGHFKGFGETNTIFHLDDPERYEREEVEDHPEAVGLRVGVLKIVRGTFRPHGMGGRGAFAGFVNFTDRFHGGTSQCLVFTPENRRGFLSRLV